MRKILLVAIGQSNWQGAAKVEQGGIQNRYRSVYTGVTDPLVGCNNWNQGGSCFPYLIDLCMERGVQLDVFNYAIGGASITHYTGKLGGSVVGNPADVANQGWMTGSEYTGGTSVLSEGDAGFDPFSLLSRTRAALVGKASKYDAIVSYWVNGESDAGVGSATYSGFQVSVANYMLASGVNAHVIGLTSKQATATDNQFVLLQQGIAQAISLLKSQGKPVAAGHDMYAKFGANPPLYPETSGPYVHMTLRGQEIQSILVNSTLSSIGY